MKKLTALIITAVFSTIAITGCTPSYGDHFPTRPTVEKETVEEEEVEIPEPAKTPEPTIEEEIVEEQEVVEDVPTIKAPTIEKKRKERTESFKENRENLRNKNFSQNPRTKQTESTDTYFKINIKENDDKIVLTDLNLTRPIPNSDDKTAPVKVYQITDRNTFYQIASSSYTVLDVDNEDGILEVYSIIPVDPMDVRFIDLKNYRINAFFIYESEENYSIKILAGVLTE